MHRLLTGLFLLFAAPALLAQTPVTPATALAKAKTDLTSSLAELDQVRKDIASDSPELAKSFAETELELREKRRLARIARMTRQDREMEIRQLERDLNIRKQDTAYLAGLLKDHALKTATLALPGEPELAISDTVIAAELTDGAQALEQRLAILTASLEQLDALIGGSNAAGSAAGPGGDILEGTFHSAGPISWFIGKDSTAAGDVLPAKHGGVPQFIPADVKAIQSLAEARETSLPIDVTGGNARALEEIDGGFLDLIRKGGLWIWPILLLALLSLVFGLVKLAEFSRIREPGDAWITAILAALRVGEREKANSIAADARHPAANVIGRLIDVSDNRADLVEETLYEQLMGVQSKAGAMLPVIAITAATSPLLGLLGTVSGMIATFNLITLFGSGDPKPLAGGISEALITTLFGLVVAIPALVLHAFLSRRSQGIVQTTERLGLSFINGLRVKS